VAELILPEAVASTAALLEQVGFAPQLRRVEREQEEINSSKQTALPCASSRAPETGESVSPLPALVDWQASVSVLAAVALAEQGHWEQVWRLAMETT
jgi:hypothetical protein